MLQTTTIFANVGKGVVAKQEELQAAFGTTDEKAICVEILARGELQARGFGFRVEPCWPCWAAGGQQGMAHRGGGPAGRVGLAGSCPINPDDVLIGV